MCGLAAPVRVSNLGARCQRTYASTPSPAAVIRLSVRRVAFEPARPRSGARSWVRSRSSVETPTLSESAGERRDMAGSAALDGQIPARVLVTGRGEPQLVGPLLPGGGEPAGTDGGGRGA